MRAPFRTLIATLFLAACSSGTTYVVQQPVPVPAPAPVPEPEPIEPLEITIGRPIAGQLVVQTNRPAYVAIFEIIPDRGVVIAHPALARQRTVMVSGLTWVPVWWRAPQPVYSGVPYDPNKPLRYIYALASDEPLLLTSEVFEVGYFQRTIGNAASRYENAYWTMRQLSRRFVPDVPNESWAEDVYTMMRPVASQPERVAHVYCAGRVYGVPEEMAARILCPATVPVQPTTGGQRPPTPTPVPVMRIPSRPDSVFWQTGQRVNPVLRRPRDRGPIDRVVPPAQPVDRAHGGDVHDDRGNNGRGNDGRDNGRGNEGRNASDDPSRGGGRPADKASEPVPPSRVPDQDKDKREHPTPRPSDNGREHAAPGSAAANAPARGDDKKKDDGRPLTKGGLIKLLPRILPTVKDTVTSQPKSKEHGWDDPAPRTSQPEDRGQKAEPQQQKSDDKAERQEQKADDKAERQEQKSDDKANRQEQKAEDKSDRQEQKADVKEQKADDKADRKAEAQDDKSERKAEQKDEPKVERKDEPKPEPKSEPKTEERKPDERAEPSKPDEKKDDKKDDKKDEKKDEKKDDVSPRFKIRKP